MNDTHPKIQEIWQKKWDQKSPQERLIIGCQMYDTAKTIVRSSIVNEQPGISPDALRRAIFERFYPELPYPYK